MSTKPVQSFVDNSRKVQVEIRSSTDGSLFSHSEMPYVTALFFKQMFEMQKVDAEREVRIVG